MYRRVNSIHFSTVQTIVLGTIQRRQGGKCSSGINPVQRSNVDFGMQFIVKCSIQNSVQCCKKPASEVQTNIRITKMVILNHTRTYPYVVIAELDLDWFLRGLVVNLWLECKRVSINIQIEWTNSIEKRYSINWIELMKSIERFKLLKLLDVIKLTRPMWSRQISWIFLIVFI